MVQSRFAGWVGRLLGGRYRVGPRLARGGLATVYEGHDEPTGIPLAIKILHPHLAGDPEYIKRFRLEAEAATGMRHPNIVRVLDHHESEADDEPTYLIMEYLEGQTLEDLLRKEAPLSPRRLALLSWQVLLALETAHARGIVHRDLKPRNVFLVRGPDELVKLLDFGVAKNVEEEGAITAVTRTGQTVGTPAYISPEQALGKPVDGRADLFALGVIMYRALSGSLPFQAPNPAAVLRAIVEDPAPRLDEHVDGLPADMCDLVDRALSKQAQDRFASAVEMRRALLPYVDPALDFSEDGTTSVFPPDTEELELVTGSQDEPSTDIDAIAVDAVLAAERRRGRSASGPREAPGPSGKPVVPPPRVPVPAISPEAPVKAASKRKRTATLRWHDDATKVPRRDRPDPYAEEVTARADDQALDIARQQLRERRAAEALEDEQEATVVDDTPLPFLEQEAEVGATGPRRGGEPSLPEAAARGEWPPSPQAVPWREPSRSEELAPASVTGDEGHDDEAPTSAFVPPPLARHRRGTGTPPAYDVPSALLEEDAEEPARHRPDEPAPPPPSSEPEEERTKPEGRRRRAKSATETTERVPWEPAELPASAVPSTPGSRRPVPWVRALVIVAVAVAAAGLGWMTVALLLRPAGPADGARPSGTPSAGPPPSGAAAAGGAGAGSRTEGAPAGSFPARSVDASARPSARRVDGSIDGPPGSVSSGNDARRLAASPEPPDSGAALAEREGDAARAEAEPETEEATPSTDGPAALEDDRSAAERAGVRLPRVPWSVRRLSDATRDRLARRQRNRAHTLLARRRYAQAAALYEQALKYVPDSASSARGYARTLSARDRTEEAFDWARYAVLLAPEAARGHVLLGDLHEQLGRPGEAEEAWRRALELGASNRRALRLRLRRVQ